MSRVETAVVGAGRLARALLPRLGEAGFPVTHVYARRTAAARSAARLAAGAGATTRLGRVARRAELILLAVPDGRIADVARVLADEPDVDWRGRVVLHHAGAAGPAPLAPLARTGAAVGVLHPLQCLGRVDVAARVLPGSAARVEGDPAARRVAKRLARALGLRVLRFSTEPLAARDRADYHAAASVVANDLVALLDLGCRLLTRAGCSERQAAEALSSLASGALEHFRAGGTEAALTGPVPRGDVETLTAHFRALRRSGSDAVAAHRALVGLQADAARRTGRRREADAVRELLAELAGARSSGV